MWHDAVLVAGKDLRIEARSRVALWQVVPFAVLVLVLLAFAIGPDQASLRHAAPGIFWVALLFSTVLAIQRSVAVESGEGTRDGLRLSGIDPAGIFLGKAAAVGLQLLVLQLVLWAGVTFLFDVQVHVVWLAVTASLLATVGLACAGVLYGGLSAGLRVRDTLLPLLVLPVLAPVLLAGSKAWEAALERQRIVGDPVAQDPRPLRGHLSRRGHRPLRAAPGGSMIARRAGRAGSTSSGCSASSRWVSRSGSGCGSRRRTGSRGTWPGCSTSTRPSPRWRCTGSGSWRPAGACSISGPAHARSSGTAWRRRRSRWARSSPR